MSHQSQLCEECRKFMLDLLNKRIRRILEVGREELARAQTEGALLEDEIGQSHCFHLMEIQRIIEGETTCGVYDDYGSPPTIEGPLFPKAAGEAQ